MSSRAPARRAKHQARSRHVQQVRESQEARTIRVEDEADDKVEDISLKTLVKRFWPVVGILMIATVITQKSDIPTALAIALLIAQAALVVFGILVWTHKHRT